MRRLRIAIAAVLAAAVFFAGLWIWIPAPTYVFLALSVGAPELFAWLIAAAIVSACLASVDRRTNRVARVAFPLALLALIAPLTVLARIPLTLTQFDHAMTEALGPHYLDRVLPDARDRLSESALSVSELFGWRGRAAVRTVRGVVFKDAPDGALTADVYRPAIDHPVPVVIQIYGGAWRHGTPGDDPDIAATLASRGYVVIAIDYRHAPAHRWPAQRDDVRTAIEWVRTHAAEYGGDPTRLALSGRSSGAQLAFIAGVTAGAPDIKAIVLYYSPVSLVEGYRQPPVPDVLGLRRVESDLIGGTLDDAPDAYRDASPLTYASRPHPPVLLIDGGKDHIVEPRFGEVLHTAMRASGRSVFLVLPWADHAFDAVPFGPSAQIARYYTERFLAWAFRES